MKGTIFDIKRFAVHDGPGIRTTVFFKGCPLQCQWCHNPESIDPIPVCIRKVSKLNGREFSEEETIGYQISPEDLLHELQKEQVFMEESSGGVTFSGGEPLMQHEFLFEMLQLCKSHGMHTTVDTTLFSGWEIINRLLTVTDLFLVDLKLMNDEEHKKYTGVSNKIILENIRKLASKGVSMRVRIPVIPGVTTSPENIKESIAFLSELNGRIEAVDLLPFHNTANEKYKRFHMENYFVNRHSMKKEELTTLKEQFEKAGFTVKIGG